MAKSTRTTISTDVNFKIVLEKSSKQDRRRSARSSRPHPRLVHRRIRHARFKGGKKFATPGELLRRGGRGGRSSIPKPLALASAVEQERTPLIGNPHLLHRLAGGLGLAAMDAVTDGVGAQPRFAAVGGLRADCSRYAVLVE